jgi:tellurite resistance protein TehA-like permease
VRSLGAEEVSAKGLATLYPGYFALAMATGITSTLLLDLRHTTASAWLLTIGIVCFAALVVANLVRAIRFPHLMIADLSSADRAFAFFTFVAACDVLGVRLAADGHREITLALAVVSALAWAALSYVVPVRLILGPRPAPVLAGANGTWFIWVVGTQSLAIAAATLARAWPQFERGAALLAVLMWSVGFVLYLMVAAVVLMRLLLLEVRPEDLTPPYWVTMGATAITVLAAARLLPLANSPAVVATRPVLAGLAVILWAFGTWLFPLLIAFGVWRHFMKRVELAYVPSMWSIVFPLSMYAVASMELGRALSLPLVQQIGRGEAVVGVVAWSVTFVAMVVALGRPVFRSRLPTDPTTS